jgi:hypothetical protein
MPFLVIPRSLLRGGFITDSNTYRGVNISAGAHDNVVVSFSADGNGHAGILIGHTANHNTVTGGTISHTADAALWVHFAANDNLLENISISTAQNPSSYGIVLWNSRRNTFRNINIREYKTGALVRADDILTLLLPYGCAQPGPGGVPQLACSNGQPTNPSCYWACGYDDADTYGNVFDQLNVAYATPDLPDTVGIQLNTDTPNANLRKVRDNPITNLLVANTRYGLLHDEATPGTVLTHQATAPIGYWGYDHVWVPNNRVVRATGTSPPLQPSTRTFPRPGGSTTTWRRPGRRRCSPSSPAPTMRRGRRCT